MIKRYQITHSKRRQFLATITTTGGINAVQNVARWLTNDKLEGVTIREISEQKQGGRNG